MTYWQDRVAIITGGSAGLGLVIAKSLALAGAQVVIVGRSNERLQQAAAELQDIGGEFATIQADITSDDDVDRLVKTTVERFGQIDMLVNNAGKSTRGRLLDTTPEQMQQLLDVNFLATVRCTLAVAEQLRKSGGHLVNIGSLACKLPGPYLGAYPASKFPVAAYSQQLRLENVEFHVLLVCPGPLTREDAGIRYDEQSADLPESAKRPGGTKLKGISPEWLAGRILTACEKRQPELVVPGKARWAAAISQLWPALGDWLINKNTK